ncbi:histidine kinase [Streptomyces sp. NPDC046977]|uniref:sensor histidine kinase n=1 Tax=Streptomyces sp. NPDC046977 TaxID=3154703 RepID=UPI0033CCFF3E
MIDLRQQWRERPRLADALVVASAAALTALVVRADTGGLPVHPLLSSPAALSWLLPPAWGLDARGMTVPLLGCAALYWRRRSPVVIALALVVLAVAWPTGVPLLVALFTVAAGRPGRVTAAVTGFALLPVLARPFVTAVLSPLTAATAVAGVAFVGGTVGWGLWVGGVRERESRAEREAALRADRARQQAREEIAREMHDVLAHRLTLLSMHAGALEFHPGAAPAQVAEAAGVIRQSASQALEDLQDVLRVLRAPTVSPHAEPPQPSLGDLPRLIEEARATGATVETHQELEDPATMDPATSRTAYRVLQEALTNHRKHAPRTPVSLTLTGGRRSGLTVGVANPVQREPATRGPGSGQGLIGMNERVRLAGGRMSHRHTATDFRLDVWLPWTR